MSRTPSATTALFKEKPHYEALDGLRGVAAILVIWYHFFRRFKNEVQNFGDKISHSP